jgi:hypothetical protein
VHYPWKFEDFFVLFLFYFILFFGLCSFVGTSMAARKSWHAKAGQISDLRMGRLEQHRVQVQG